MKKIMLSSMFCLLIYEIKILVITRIAIYIRIKFRSMDKTTKARPNVVKIQNRNARRKELPKKENTFLEKPFTASLNPPYILHLTFAMPVMQAILI
jgi:hypothetical protein